jgi:hypothetical protein
MWPGLPEGRRATKRTPRWSIAVGRKALRAGAAGVSGSFLLHLFVLLVISLLIFDRIWDPQPLSTEWSQTEDGPPSLPESVAAPLEIESAAQPTAKVPQIDTALLEGREHVLDDSLSEAMLQYVAEFDSQASDSGHGLLQAPAGARVVRKGSFSVWTVPKDPLPFQEYKIVIQIRLPDLVRRYRATDLSGEVEGTDRYRQQIPWDPKWKGRTDVALTIRKGQLVPLRKGDFLPVRDRIAQLVIRVPPAKRLVRDRIKIRSKLLKEEQVLEIVF